MGCILAVDDEPSVLGLYQKVLIKRGFTLLTAMNGLEAVEACKNYVENIDLVLMDHRLPVMDGIQATKEILSFNKGVRILFISADAAAKKAAIKAGAKGFLKKPFTLKALLSKIDDGRLSRQ